MPIPIILDTDIGGDIDDTWALAMLLRSPELDLKMVVTATGDTPYRARVAARLLEVAGRSDVPVAIGLHQAPAPEAEGPPDDVLARPQAPWVEGYDLDDYPGPVHHDGVAALIDALMTAPEPVTLIAIGPLPNIAEALKREPGIVEHVARFVGMHGSVRVGYGGSSSPVPEYNVATDVPAMRAVLDASWPITITPLDTCGLVQLTGDRYARVRASADPLTRALIENVDIWTGRVPWPQDGSETRSSILFDTVAVYLAFSEALVDIEELPLRVTDDGITTVAEDGRPVRCATRWKDLDAFEELLVARLMEPAT